MKNFIIVSLLVLSLYGCTRPSSDDLKPHLTCLHIIDQNGFTETIASKDRLENYKNIDFSLPQPYQKVMQVFSKDIEGIQKSIITSYHPNGYLRQYLEISNNRAFGKYQEWNSNGTLKIDSNVIGGVADLSPEAEKSFVFDGISKAYDKEGRIAAIVKYNRGDLEGNYTTYHSNGNIATSYSYKNNLLEGLSLNYREDGSVVEKTEYLHGQKDGVSQFFYENNAVKSNEVFVKGDLVEGKYFSKEGVLVSEIICGNGFKTLFDNDQFIEKHEYKKGIQEGIVEVYGKKGELIRQYHLKGEYKNGEEIIYAFDPIYERSIKKISLNWVDGCIQGRVKVWYENGLLEAEMEISGNKKNGNYTAWYKNGQLMFIEEYHQDLLVSGQYFKPSSFSPVSKVINGNGIATLYDGDGTFLKKITYIDSQANS